MQSKKQTAGGRKGNQSPGVAAGGLLLLVSLWLEAVGLTRTPSWRLSCVSLGKERRLQQLRSDLSRTYAFAQLPDGKHDVQTDLLNKK